MGALFRLINRWSAGGETHHHDDSLDLVRESLIATLFPVGSRVTLLSQHHSGTMREPMYRGERWLDQHLDVALGS